MYPAKSSLHRQASLIGEVGQANNSDDSTNPSGAFPRAHASSIPKLSYAHAASSALEPAPMMENIHPAKQVPKPHSNPNSAFQGRGSSFRGPRNNGTNRNASTFRNNAPLNREKSTAHRPYGFATQDGLLNEHLTERIARGKNVGQTLAGSSLVKPSLTTNLSIRKYMEVLDSPADPSHWTGFSEVPSFHEVFDKGRTDHDSTVEIPENIIIGPYGSKEDYIERHYSLLREDAVAPLRDAVSEVQVYNYLMEKDSDTGASIYEKVFITGLVFASIGLAAHVTFSLGRVGKKINWEQSKRLLTGAVVALTPANDLFKSVCHIAVIAARPLTGLQQNPPEIDLFFGDPDGFEIDPQQEWLMVESRNSFYEAHRHTLRSLQMLAKERFPLSEHIVKVEKNIKPPDYVVEQPLKDLSKLFTAADEDARNINILADWPKDLSCELDKSQTDALKRILGKRLAIVQGPPGTGKTHVSVIAIQLLLENMVSNDPPLLLAAKTNHALDQLLRHVARFEPDFIRLGGWTKDMDIVKPRTLHEVKDTIRMGIPLGSMRKPALAKLAQLAKEISALLDPLTQGHRPLSARLFKDYGIISDVQYESLTQGAKGWVNAVAEDETVDEIAIWLGDERIEAKHRTSPEDFGIEIEEPDLEFEQLKELEAESRLVEDEDHETLRGNRLVFNEPFTGHQGIGIVEQSTQVEMRRQDLWAIPSEYRGSVYRVMQRQVKDLIRDKFRVLARQYAMASRGYKIGGWELDYNYLKQVRVIGMTTTGLSKYRGLLQSLEPRIVMIEEAAETLEAPISVACFDTLQQLVLVGDHQQLRGSCNDEELAGPPFYLGVSMFERLVRNRVEHSQLTQQRRMIPEIRRLLMPIYDELEDYLSVRDWKPIPGMGGLNSFFFSHKWRETNDTHMSKTNHDEADMVVSFFDYLVANGVPVEDITVLTFYNGQRKLILRKLRERLLIQGRIFKVVTVDSYQGEENAVVILSLVRSNAEGKIGFLNIENRICVALSRAQRGFYIFGDAPSLCASSMLWWQILQVMATDPCRVGFSLPLTCGQHNDVTFIDDPRDFKVLDGGCTRPCNGHMPCGHICSRICHPLSSDLLGCKSDCNCEVVGEQSPDYVQPTAATQTQVSPEKGRENAEARSKTLDDENFAALFGLPPIEDEETSEKKHDNVSLVRTISDGQGGTRNVWKGTMLVPRPRNVSPPRKENLSLLDL